jgi:hypothetical protein
MGSPSIPYPNNERSEAFPGYKSDNWQIYDPVYIIPSLNSFMKQPDFVATGIVMAARLAVAVGGIFSINPLLQQQVLASAQST